MMNDISILRKMLHLENKTACAGDGRVVLQDSAVHNGVRLLSKLFLLISPLCLYGVSLDIYEVGEAKSCWIELVQQMDKAKMERFKAQHYL